MSRTPALLVVGALLTAACLPSAHDATVRNCDNAIASFERMRCTNVLPMPDEASRVDFEYEMLRRSCPDPANQPRLAAITKCIAGFHDASAKRDTSDEEIRKRFATQTAKLKTDPEYLSALTTWQGARDEAQIATHAYKEHGMPIRSPYERQMEAKTKMLRVAEDQLRSVIVKHGIDPQYSQILGVW